MISCRHLIGQIGFLRSKNVDSLSATHSNKTQTNREETNTQVSLCRAERRRKKKEGRHTKQKSINIQIIVRERRERKGGTMNERNICSID